MKKPSPVVVDSFAIICFLEKQPGWEQVRSVLRDLASARRRAILSLINLGEIHYIVAQRTGATGAKLAMDHLSRLPIEIAEVDRTLTLLAAQIKAEHSVSYADAFCLATASVRGARVLTGDPEFESADEIVEILWLPRRTHG